MPDEAGEASPAGSPGTPASRPVFPALENELLKKLEAERAAGRFEQWRHAATNAARLAAAMERDEARVEVARLTAEVRRAKGLPACLQRVPCGGGRSGAAAGSCGAAGGRETAPAALDRDRAIAAA